MIWRTCGSDSSSSARSAYSTRAVGLTAPAATRPRYCAVSASSRSSRRPRASLVAVPRDGMRSPRIRREIVEWSTPDCWASCRCDIFLALSWARSHSLKARPFWEVVIVSYWAPLVACAGGAAMPALSGLIGLTLYHPFVPVAVFPTERRQAGWVGSAPVQARDPRRLWAVGGDTTR